MAPARPPTAGATTYNAMPRQITGAPYAHSRTARVVLDKTLMPQRYSPALVSIVAMLALCVVACSSSSTSSVGTGPTSPKCQITAAQPSNILADGGTGTIAITAQPECEWTVSSQPSWISDVSPTSGQGNGNVAFRAAANPTPSTREGEIVVNDNHVRVIQEAAACPLTIAPDAQTVNSSSVTANVAVSTLNGCTWTATSNASWITITSGAQGNGNGSVALRIAANTGAARTGTVTIGDRTHTITQQDASQPPLPPAPAPPTAPSCTNTITPASESIADAGGPGTVITVTAGGTCAWTAVSNASWITITGGAAGTGNGSVSFTVAANTAAVRIGTMTIAGQTFTVTQAAPPPPPPPPPPPSCTYTIAPASESIADAGGTGTAITVTAGGTCAWTAISSASWITITAGAAGTGNGSVSYIVAANTGAARTGTIAIGGQTFTVNQAAAPTCSYSLAASSASLSDVGGTGFVSVSAPGGCAWTATTSASWITITAGAIGASNGSVSFTVAANTGAARTGTMTIAGQTFTVNQAAAPPPPPPPSCTYTIAPTSESIAAAGGAGTAIAVTTGATCAWTAVSNAPSWITITAGAAGMGTGSVSFTVAANTGPARTGTMTIAGQTFTVSQAGPPPTALIR